MADLIFNKSVDVLLIFQLLFFTFPFILTFVIPVSVLLASLLAFTKLSMDHEMIAIRSSGVSLFKVLLPIFLVVIMISMGTYLLSDRISSISHYQYRRIMSQIGIDSPGAILEEGTFIKKFKNFVIFIYEINKNELKGIRIYQPQEGRPTRTIIAQKGELVSIPEKGVVKLRLFHGTSDEPDPKDPGKFYKLNFKTYDLPLNLTQLKETGEITKKPKDMSVKEIKSEISRLKEEGIKDTYSLAAEIQNKAALAMSSIVFLLIGAAAAIGTHRREKRMSFGVGLLALGLYWLLLIGGHGLAKKGVVNAVLGLQFANIVLGSTSLFFFIRKFRT